MKKYTLTTVDKLKPGDTFIKDNDPKEIIYTVLDRNCTIPLCRFARKGENMMPDIISLKQSVIFLTHKPTI